MQLKIQNGVVELSGEVILNNINFEINDNSRIAVVGRNGCGKTTLLKLIAGEYSITKRDSDLDTFFTVSGKPQISMLTQMTFKDDNVSMLHEIRSAYSDILELGVKLKAAQAKMEAEQTEENIKIYTNLLDTFTNMGGFYFEREYESAIKHFGFTESDKNKPLCEFSGGQRTRIAFLKLLLSKPDILLLDEPTNHLDIEATEWLEGYLKTYKKAFVVVSHDRMFLDNVASTVCEIENGKLYKYNGNYSQFVEQKRVLREQQAKEYLAQKKEIERLENLADRFRYKATKATMAQSKLKQIERMEIIEAPENEDLRRFHANFEPRDLGVKDMLTVEALSVGYESVLSVVDLNVHLGDKIGIIGGNGLGKSTFIRTLMGQIKALGGKFKFAERAKIGYFEQQMAQYASNKTVLEDFCDTFPSLTEFEARSALAAFLFTGEEVFKTVSVLSGGERVRLAICKILQRKPNFLILDEPTNHMDIIGKESLEEMLKNFGGTVIFVSHDRYFIKQVATKILDFSKGNTKLYDYGYDYYLQKRVEAKPEAIAERVVREKKTYTTPLKERSKLEREVKKAEEKIARLEAELDAVQGELLKPENISDYIKLSELQQAQQGLENELEETMILWEKASEKLAELLS